MVGERAGTGGGGAEEDEGEAEGEGEGEGVGEVRGEVEERGLRGETRDSAVRGEGWGETRERPGSGSAAGFVWNWFILERMPELTPVAPRPPGALFSFTPSRAFACALALACVLALDLATGFSPGFASPVLRGAVGGFGGVAIIA